MLDVTKKKKKFNNILYKKKLDLYKKRFEPAGFPEISGGLESENFFSTAIRIKQLHGGETLDELWRSYSAEIQVGSYARLGTITLSKYHNIYLT